MTEHQDQANDSLVTAAGSDGQRQAPHPDQHGYVRYQNRGCRCAVCTKDHAERQRQYRARKKRPRRNEHGVLFVLDPAKCPATFDVQLVLDDGEGPEPITHQCQKAPGHHPATPHATTVQWFSEEDA